MFSANGVGSEWFDGTATPLIPEGVGGLNKSQLNKHLLISSGYRHGPEVYKFFCTSVGHVGCEWVNIWD